MIRIIAPQRTWPRVPAGVYLALAALALAGCTTTKYLVTPCIGKDQAIPEAPPKIHDKLTGKADEDTRTLAGGLLRWQAYGRGLREIIETCRQ